MFRLKSFLSFLFCLALFIPLSFLFKLLPSLNILEQLNPISWEEVSCVILEQKTAPPLIKYEYTYQGDSYQSLQLNFKNSFPEDEGLDLLMSRYQVGTQHLCRVNPSNPEKSYLAFSIFKPLCAIGIFISIWLALGLGALHHFMNFIRGKESHDLSFTSILILIPIGFICIVLGSIAVWSTFIQPLHQLVQSQNWEEVPCQIKTLQIEHHKGRKSRSSNTYSIKTLFHYKFKGHSYIQTQFSFDTGSDSFLREKEFYIEYYNHLKEPICWVDPNRPYQAVLRKQVDPFIGLNFLFSIFILIGFLILFAIFFGYLRSSPPVKSFEEIQHRSQSFHPSAQRKSHFVLLVLGLLFTLYLTWAFYKKWHIPNPNNWSSLDETQIIMFSSLGCGVLFCLFRLFKGFLALKNPKTHLSLSPYPISPYFGFTLSWKTDGDHMKCESISFYLIGTEKIKTGRNNTKKHIFHEQLLTQAILPEEKKSSKIEIQIDKNILIHSRLKEDVEWSIKVISPIKNWPDSKEEYYIDILPIQKENPSKG